jgi:hypothetical protein
MPVRLVPQTRARVALDGGGPAGALPPFRARTCVKRKSNQPAAGNAGNASRLAIQRYWPGMPEPER